MITAWMSLLSRMARKVFETFGLPVGQLEGPVQIGLERVGDGYGIDLAGPQEVLEVELTHSAGANQAHAYPVIGPQDALRDRPSRGGNAHGGTSQALVELSPSYLKIGHFLLYLLMHFACGRSGAEPSALQAA